MVYTAVMVYIMIGFKFANVDRVGDLWSWQEQYVGHRWSRPFLNFLARSEGIVNYIERQICLTLPFFVVLLPPLEVYSNLVETHFQVWSESMMMFFFQCTLFFWFWNGVIFSLNKSTFPDYEWSFAWCINGVLFLVLWFKFIPIHPKYGMTQPMTYP